MASEMANTVGWYILEGYPWWPVYICDQFKLRTNLHQLGDGHKKILKKAKDFPKDYALVYYFGSYSFSLVKLNKGILKPWDCSEKDQYLSGHPKHLMKKGTTADDLQVAIREVEDYLSQPEDMRLPPFMVPSDLDPALEAPPPMERPEEEEDDGDEDMENDDDADGGDGPDGDEDMDHDDGDKKSKKTKKTTKKATKKEKTEKEKKPKKEKKEKEKKPPKEKKEKKTPSKDKEKKSDTKKKSDDAGKEKPAKLKRQRSSTGDDADGAETSKAKQHKKEKAADVKTGDDENLAETLEREIRWILSNEQYEEMTTKMLRKVLEERLKRDLKQHRETIKAVVTRVIEEEEDAAAATGGEATTQESEKGDGDVKMDEEEPVKTEAKVEPIETTNGAAPEEPEKKDEEPAPVKEEVKTEEVKKEDEKIEDVKDEVKEQPAAAPPPKPVDEADILAIKDKLVDSETTHEELLASLDELHQMPLDLSHLKHTGIARVVANLRQHANDKVSIAAKELRNAWMQLAEKGKPSTLKKLEKMNETLESDGTSDATKLSVLQKLEKLSVTTQEIIDAKIGVTISKLRKSSQAEVAEAANKLRQKWKRLAAASSTSS